MNSNAGRSLPSATHDHSIQLPDLLAIASGSNITEFQVGSNTPRQSSVESPTNPSTYWNAEYGQRLDIANDRNATLLSQAAHIRGAIEILEAEHRSLLSTYSLHRPYDAQATSGNSHEFPSSCGQGNTTLYNLHRPSNSQSRVPISRHDYQQPNFPFLHGSLHLSGSATAQGSQQPTDNNRFSPQQMSLHTPMFCESLAAQLHQSHRTFPTSADRGVSMGSRDLSSLSTPAEVSRSHQPATYNSLDQPPAGAAFFASLSSLRRRNRSGDAPGPQSPCRGQPSRVAGKAVLDAAVSTTSPLSLALCLSVCLSVSQSSTVSLFLSIFVRPSVSPSSSLP